MKQSAIAVVLVVILSGSLWLLLPHRQPMVRWIPSDAMALLVLNEIPTSLDFISETRLKDWLEIDADGLAAKYAGDYLIKELAPRLSGAWIILHALDQKENGAYRIAFTALLFPRLFQYSRVRLITERSVRERFGNVIEEGPIMDPITLIRGDQPGEVLYIAEIESFVLVANVDVGWRRALTPSAENGSLFDQAGFRRISQTVGLDSDIFLYFRGAGLLLPEFGYGIDLDSSSGFTDRYCEIPPE